MKDLFTASDQDKFRRIHRQGSIKFTIQVISDSYEDRLSSLKLKLSGGPVILMTTLVMLLAVKVNQQTTLSVAKLVTLDWISKRIHSRTITTDMLILSRRIRIPSALRIVKFLEQIRSVPLRILSEASLVTRFPHKKMPMKILEI